MWETRSISAMMRKGRESLEDREMQEGSHCVSSGHQKPWATEGELFMENRLCVLEAVGPPVVTMGQSHQTENKDTVLLPSSTKACVCDWGLWWCMHYVVFSNVCRCWFTIISPTISYYLILHEHTHTPTPPQTQWWFVSLFCFTCVQILWKQSSSIHPTIQLSIY